MIISFLLWIFGIHFTSSASPVHLLTSAHWVWSDGSGIRYLVLSLQNGRGNPWQTMDLEGNDPETEKWMQSNLVFSLPSNSLRSSYHLLIHVLVLKLVWGCSPGHRLNCVASSLGSPIWPGSMQRHGQREQESLLNALWAHPKNRLSSFSRHIH